MKKSGLWDAVLAGAARPEGIGQYELLDFGLRKVADAFYRLKRLKKIFKVGVRKDTRAFIRQEDADAYREKLKARYLERKRNWDRNHRKPYQRVPRVTQGERILAAASQQGGCSPYDFPDLTAAQVRDSARHLAEAGKLYVAGNRQLRRFFADPAEAMVYEASIPKLKKEKKRENNRKRAKVVRQKVAKAPKSPKPPKPPAVRAVHIPKYVGPKWEDDAPAIIPDHVKVQVIPSPPAFGLAAKYGIRT